MLTDKSRSAGLNDRAWLLGAGTMEIDLPCNLFLASTTFAEYDAVGVCVENPGADDPCGQVDLTP